MHPHTLLRVRQITTLLLVSALVFVTIPIQIQAFMPTQTATDFTHSSGSATHESITRDAIEDYDKDLFGLRQGNKPLTKNMTDAINAIIDSNASVDSGKQFYQAAPHFDGETFQVSQTRLVDYKLKVKDLVDPPKGLFGAAKPNVSRARFYLGQALHTLQDFYSHEQLGRDGKHQSIRDPWCSRQSVDRSFGKCENVYRLR
jgi:von Willebrand factor A domain-containing protein 7